MAISLVTSSRDTSSGTVTLPSSIVDGDLVVAVINNSVPVTPTGWTQVTGGSGSRVVYAISDSGTSLAVASASTQFGSGTVYVIQVLVFRASAGAIGVGYSGSTSATSTTPTWPAFTAIAPSFRLVRVHMQFSGTADYLTTASDCTSIDSYNTSTGSWYGTSVGWTGVGPGEAATNTTTTSHLWRTFTVEIYEAPAIGTYVVDSVTHDASSGTTTTVTLPSYQAGDMLFVFCGQGTGNTISTGGTGWTNLSGNSIRSILLAKVADGTEGTTLGFSSTGSSGWNAVAWSVRNWDSTSTFDVTNGVSYVQGADNTGTTYDPPSDSVDASWDNGQWIVTFAVVWMDWATGRTWSSGTPTGYTNLQLLTPTVDSNNGAGISFSYKYTGPSAEDPGSVTVSTSTAGNEGYTVRMLLQDVVDSGNGLFWGI